MQRYANTFVTDSDLQDKVNVAVHSILCFLHVNSDSSSSLNLRQVRPPSAKHSDHVSHPATPRSSGRDVLSHSATQVKVSRRDLRLMSEEEISMRRSNRQSGGSITPRGR